MTNVKDTTAAVVVKKNPVAEVVVKMTSVYRRYMQLRLKRTTYGTLRIQQLQLW